MKLMSLVKEYFEEYGRVLMDELTRAGFSINQAIDFLAEAAEVVASSLDTKTDRQLTDNQPNAKCKYICAQNNIQQLRQRTGFNQQLIISGLQIMSPLLQKTVVNSSKADRF